jgi:hypothetical protein
MKAGRRRKSGERKIDDKHETRKETKERNRLIDEKVEKR